jgi:hypothetical protein
MPDDTKGPLDARVGEQLEAKARLEEASGAERRDDERARERVGRRNADEQATVLERTGGEHRVSAKRVRGLPLKPLAAVAGALVLLNGRRRRGRIARVLVPLGAASFVVALRRGWTPAALGAR